MRQIGEEYRTGLEHIDAEHIVLLDLTDRTKKLLEDQNMLFKNDEICTLLSELGDYTVQHFAHEEAFMADIGFDGLEAQKAQHKLFEKKLAEFSEAVERVTLGTQDDMIRELFDYLMTWLHDHIKTEDMKYAKFANRKAETDH